MAESEFVVRRIDVVSGRPWLFLSGELSGGPLAIGDEIEIADDRGERVRATVRSIELHTAAGTTTVAVDDAVRDAVSVGTVLVRSASSPD